MDVYLSHESIRSWADPGTYHDGREIYQRGGVSDVRIEDGVVHAAVDVSGRVVRTRFRILPSGDVETHCPCRYAQRQGLICIHVVAAGCHIADRTEDPVRERRLRIEARRRRSGPGAAGPAKGGPERSRTPAALRLRLEPDWLEQWRRGHVEVACLAVFPDRKRRLDKLGDDVVPAFDERDTHLAYVLADLAGTVDAPGRLTVDREGFLELLAEVAPGELAVLDQPAALRVDPEPLLSMLSIALEPATGELRVCHLLDRDAGDLMVGKKRGWVRTEDGWSPLDAVLPDTLRDAYANGGAMIARERVLPFLEYDLPALEERFLVDCEVSRDAFTVTDGMPAFCVELTGTPELLETRLWASYGSGRVRAGSTARGGPEWFPVPGQALAYTRRNPAAEREAVLRLAAAGPFAWDERNERFHDIREVEQVMTVLSESVPDLRRQGWTVEFGGMLESLLAKAEWVRPVVTVTAGESAGWFEAAIRYRDRSGGTLDPSRIESSLAQGGGMLPDGDRILLLQGSLIESVQGMINECRGADPAHPERISDVYAGYLHGALETQEAVVVEADTRWREHAKQQSERIHLEPVSAGELLDRVLRPYQREGVAWLRFLERSGYNGILADDMGLGKTVQALAWLQLERLSASARGLPSLVVCPTSLMDNWAREAARFVPDRSCLVMAGAERHRTWDAIAGHHLVVTSYALLRRDVGRYVDQPFAVVVLDEAQHIKNRSTQNALAAKQLRAIHRLVLTGTPMENSVSDLWSIMDFLMPGYLGPHPRFRETIERPASAGGEQADRALRILRCKMQPFMLRRLKSTVARDLPEKVARVATCHLAPDQADLYLRLQHEYQDTLRALIDRQGFARSRFTVLKTLLRLRQLCCHPALLKINGIDATAPSAKVDLFFELLNEAMDGNHRVLVFSQFVEMLHILRGELQRRSIPFAYLDGATRNRQQEIDRFNQDDEIPLFLVSLKAGGTGLNLTGANVVIHYDPWWNPAVEDQATDRVHRIGQARNVYSIKLVTRGTVEEKVLELQERKRRLFDATVGGASDAVSSLSWDDVRHLLAL